MVWFLRDASDASCAPGRVFLRLSFPKPLGRRIFYTTRSRRAMSYADKTLTCRDCGTQFVFTAGEQEFSAQKGFTNEPTRCPSCRQARKQGGGRSSGGYSDRDSYGGGGGGYSDRDSYGGGGGYSGGGPRTGGGG